MPVLLKKIEKIKTMLKLSYKLDSEFDTKTITKYIQLSGFCNNLDIENI